jgi:serine/threonine protein kinase
MSEDEPPSSPREFGLQAIFDSLEEHGYIFVSRIGSGNFAQVFTVRHVRYDEIFCAKVIDMCARQGPKCKWNTFTLEVKSLVDLSHINIINVFDQWELDNFCCLILEYAEGGSLTDYVSVRQKLTGSQLW